MKIYLDNCCFNRPYDDQSFLSIYLETQAKLAIQALVNENELNLIWSFILDYENSVNPDENIKQEIFNWRSLAKITIRKNDTILKKAKEILKIGLGKKDALHLASAFDGKVDYFITVDKGILKKDSEIREIKIVNPIKFIEIYEETKNEK